MRDLQNPKLMWLKAGLFLLLGGASFGLVFLEAPTLKVALLLALAVWSFLPRLLLRLLRAGTLRGSRLQVLRAGFTAGVSAASAQTAGGLRHASRRLNRRPPAASLAA